MKIPHDRTPAAIALALHAATLSTGCSAFGRVGLPPIMIRIANNNAATRSCAIKSGDESIRRVTSGSGDDVIVGSSPSASPPESELESALEYARDMDKKYGLCTEPSRRAWKVVDEMYERMHAMARTTAPREVRGD